MGIGCGDTEHCPNQFCRPGEGPKGFLNSSVSQSGSSLNSSVNQGGSSPALYKTLVWVYEWPRGSVAATPVPHAAARLVARLGLRQLLEVDEEQELQDRLLQREPSVEA